MKILVLLSAFLISFSSFYQIPEGFPHLTEDKIAGAVIQSESTYTKESLFGYMNGGAELYLEYGFDRLAMTEIEIGDNEYKLEVYKMDDRASAFGIYSVSVFRCDTSGHIGDYSCQSDYQLQFCKGPYYVSIVNDAGNSEAVQESAMMAGILESMIQETSFVISDFMHGIPFEEEIIKTTLVKGELGLYNGANEWSELLQDAENYSCLIVEGAGEAVLSIKFDDDQSQAAFMKSLGIDSHPPVNDEVNIGVNTSLAVNYDNVIMIRRRN
ncbi:MAG: hypothetical protein PF495_20885 [Spirochaetales bacterium]|jgi:hypothetical protein|nr:hypothetical protein [Spirochaetales bacterium]